MNFLTPLAFLGALLAIPIILLYMLRLRRREMQISSTFLWQQVLQDNEANTPWQRLRRNLLLFLQLLILALLVFTLARPYISVPAVSAGQTALLLDATASMNATDLADGESRFDAARREALSVLDTLDADSAMTVIRVTDVPEVLVPYTTDRGRVREAINSARPGTGQGDWNAALNLALAGRTAEEEFSVVIVGDGGLGATDGLPGIEGELAYVPVGVSGDNLAISALATRSLPGEAPQLFAQITNYGAVDAEVIFSLRIDDELRESQSYTVPAGANLPIVSTAALGADFSALEANLTLSVNTEAQDYLTTDNAAYTVTAQNETRRALLMSNGNVFAEQVLRSMPGIETFRGNIEAGIPSQPYDLYIFDDYLPETLPDGDIFFINPPQDTAVFSVGDFVEGDALSNVLVDASDPRVTFVNFDPVGILRARELTNVDWADPLIVADGGPLLVAGEIDGRQLAIMPFDLRESDLPLNIAWPILVANLVNWFTPQDALTQTTNLTIGGTLVIRPPFEAENIRVTLPDGDSRTLPIEAETLIFAETGNAGVYMLEALAGDVVLRRQPLAVNLFSPLESSIAPVAPGSLQVGNVTIAVPETEELGQRELWPIVALLALLVLMIEWYAYWRRLRVPTVGRTVRGATARRAAA